MGTGLPYRSPPLDHLDRFTMAHFGLLNARAEMFLDNVSVERSGACPCACDWDPDPACDIFDFLAFQTAFVAGDPCACEFDPAPACDIFDFLAFQTAFVAGEPCACEFDPDPACDIFDFLAFQTQFVVGCP